MLAGQTLAGLLLGIVNQQIAAQVGCTWIHSCIAQKVDISRAAMGCRCTIRPTLQASRRRRKSAGYIISLPSLAQHRAIGWMLLNQDRFDTFIFVLNTVVQFFNTWLSLGAGYSNARDMPFSEQSPSQVTAWAVVGKEGGRMNLFAPLADSGNIGSLVPTWSNRNLL